jgi:glycosyltransferase involved in cell wall biosynthesis
MPPAVAAFTDTYLPTVNGVSYTLQTWRERWQRRGGRMDVVYPMAGGYVPEAGERPVRSLPFPFYQGFRLGLPRVPDGLGGVDVVHAHTPFSLGIAGYRYARRRDLPLVASFHTPVDEYADYVALSDRLEPMLEAASRRWERFFFSRADAVLAPSESTRRYLTERLDVHGPGPDTDIGIVPNGVDIERFRPMDPASLRERYDLPEEPLVGYTGRHGYEKRLHEIVEACDGTGLPLVFAGDGPAREDLEARARVADVDVRFLGFLDREELPAFYSALDVFAFPSPVETQGLVALEANACGTPVAGVDSGALVDTVEEGVTGYRYPEGDVDAFRACIRRCLDEYDRLRERCLERREKSSVEHAVDALADVYDDVL